LQWRRESASVMIVWLVLIDIVVVGLVAHFSRDVW
jgi:hypothetical protein